MDRRANLIREIKNQLAIYAVRVDMDKGEASRAAENFYCDLLNILLGYNLQNMNRDHPNFPAIDLGENSENRKLGVQVTSTTTRQKVQDTLDTFFRHGLEKTYTRVVMLIVGKWTESRKSFRMNGTLDFDPNRDIWDTDWLVAKIEAIQDIEHLERIMDHLKKHINLAQPQPAPLDLPLRTAMNEDNFVGRERELAEIAERFGRNEQIVVLSGLGGIGKTELAVRFAQNRWDGESYFVGYTENWKCTVLDNIAPFIPTLNRDTTDKEQIYRDAMAALRNRSAEELLILDNVDQEAGTLTQLKRELSGLRMRLIITTRTGYEHAIDVARLHRAELHRLFDQHKAEATEAERNALIDAVDGHTLTVDLMARALRPGRRAATAEKLLKDLSDNTIKKVDTAYPGITTQARINEHLKTVFKVSVLGEAEQELLRYATILPANGMDDELFLAPFEEKEVVDELLQDLVDNGWLLWKNDLLQIHPVIRIVCREVLTPTMENCEDFLEGIWEEYESGRCEIKWCQQIALLFMEAIQTVGRIDEDWETRIKIIIDKLTEGQCIQDDYSGAFESRLRALGLKKEDDSRASMGNNNAIYYSTLTKLYAESRTPIV